MTPSARDMISTSGISPSAAWSCVAAGVAILGAFGARRFLYRCGTTGNSVDLRWRRWLRNPITAEGAAPAYAPGERCHRCGDRRGTPHECRDLAR